MSNIVPLPYGFMLGADLIPQHRLLTRKEWRWIKKRRAHYCYWTVTGPEYRDDNECWRHVALVHVNPETEVAK